LAKVFVIQFSAPFHFFLDAHGFTHTHTHTHTHIYIYIYIYIYIVNFNLDKVVVPVGGVSESNIIIDFPFSEVKLAGLYWRYIYRLTQFSVLIFSELFKNRLCAVMKI
jgi:hypothetical protein